MPNAMTIEEYASDTWAWAGYIDGIWIVFGTPEQYRSEVIQHPSVMWPVATVLEALDEDFSEDAVTQEIVDEARRQYMRVAPGNVR